MKDVVRAWTVNVNAGNSAAEARLFSVPALISMMGGPYGCWCVTAAQVVRWHAQLPCSAEIVWIKVRGRYAAAMFRLGEREVEISTCVDAGTLTATRFTIVRGKITALEQMWWKPSGRKAIYATRPATPRWALPPGEQRPASARP